MKMNKIHWQEPSRYKTMIKKILPYSLQILWVITIIAVLVYVVTWDVRIENKIKSIETQPAPAIDAPIPTEPNPHIKHINMLENRSGMPLSRIAKLIIAEEGVQPEPYLDSEGIVTIGIGRSLQTNGVTTAELRAIVPNLDYDLLIESATIQQGRIKISSIESAKQIFTKPLTEHDMHLLLADDLKSVLTDAVRVFGSDWHKIDTVRQEAILDIIYNLGLPHFKGFVKFIDAVKKQDWKKAASELLLSEAARKNYSRYNHVSLVIDTGDEKYFNLKGE